MKKFNLIFALVLVACLGFSFIADNNFTATNLATLKSDTISQEKFMKWIDEALVTPIETCYKQVDEHAFMTKCYTHLTFEIDKRYEHTGIPRNSDVTGSLVFVECGNDGVKLADVRANFSNKSIRLRESAKAASQNKDEFIKSTCEHAKTNGLPKADF